MKKLILISVIVSLFLVSCSTYQISNNTNYTKQYTTDSTMIWVSYDSTVYKIK